MRTHHLLLARRTSHFALLLCLAVSAGAAPARIVLDLERDLGPVNRMVLGTNTLAHLAADGDAAPKTGQPGDRGDGIWDPEKRQVVPEMAALAREAGVAAVRWPGGCASHHFEWKRAAGPPEKRPQQRFGLPEFLRSCAEIGAVPIITVAEYAGTTQDAADLVEYCNAPNDGEHRWAALRAADGHPEPWNVTWFEFGSESHHGDHKGARMSAVSYADSYLNYRAAMRKADPKVRLGAVLANSVSAKMPEWTRVVLNRAGKEMDFAIHHASLPSYTSEDGKPDAKTLFGIALAGDRQLDAHYEALHALIRETTGRDGIPLAVTEYGGHFVQEKPVPYRHSLGNALVNAEMVRVLMQPRHRVALANHRQFANAYWGAVKGDAPPYVRRPTYYVFQLYARHFGEVLVPAAVECARYDSPGGLGVEPAHGEPREEQLSPANLVPVQEWQFFQIPGVVQREYHGVLIVDFRTDQDLGYYHAAKRLPARPNTWYRLTAAARADGLQSANGGFLQIGDLRGAKATGSFALTAPLTGTTDWVELTADYLTLPDTGELMVQVRRQEGGGAGEGQFVVGDVRVQRLIPGSRGATPVLGVNASRSRDGKRAFVMVVNKNLTAAEEVVITGARAAAARAWTLTGPAVDATNEEQPDRVAVSELPAAVEDGAVRLTLPPCSLTAVEIDVP